MDYNQNNKSQNNKNQNNNQNSENKKNQNNKQNKDNKNKSARFIKNAPQLKAEYFFVGVPEKP